MSFGVVAVLIAGTIGIASVPAQSASPERVTICHATGSASNPYVQITVSDNAVGRAAPTTATVTNVVRTSSLQGPMITMDATGVWMAKRPTTTAV